MNARPTVAGLVDKGMRAGAWNHRQQSREDATQPPRSHFAAADVTRQGNDPETGYGGLLETNHVITQESGVRGMTHLVLAFA